MRHTFLLFAAALFFSFSAQANEPIFPKDRPDLITKISGIWLGDLMGATTYLLIREDGTTRVYSSIVNNEKTSLVAIYSGPLAKLSAKEQKDQSITFTTDQLNEDFQFWVVESLLPSFLKVDPKDSKLIIDFNQEKTSMEVWLNRKGGAFNQSIRFDKLTEIDIKDLHATPKDQYIHLQIMQTTIDNFKNIQELKTKALNDGIKKFCQSWSLESAQFRSTDDFGSATEEESFEGEKIASLKEDPAHQWLTPMTQIEIKDCESKNWKIKANLKTASFKKKLFFHVANDGSWSFKIEGNKDPVLVKYVEDPLTQKKSLSLSYYRLPYLGKNEKATQSSYNLRYNR